VLAGVDPDSTPLGDYTDAVWAAYVEHARSTSPEQAEALDEAWQKLSTPIVAPPRPVVVPDGPAGDDAPAPAPARGAPARRPTKEEREAWAIAMAQQAGPNPLMAEAQAGQQAAPKMGG
jgi:hypothetical protein